MKTVKLNGGGVIFTYTIIRVSSDQFDAQVPYPIAIIKLDEGPCITAQIVDCDTNEIKIGMRVIVTFRKIQEDSRIGAIYYGYKFKPCNE